MLATLVLVLGPLSLMPQEATTEVPSATPQAHPKTMEECEEEIKRIRKPIEDREASLIEIANNAGTTKEDKERARTAKARLDLLRHNRDIFDQLVGDAKLSGRLTEIKPELLENEFQVKAMRHPYSKGNFSWQVLGGVEFSEGQGSFSAPTGYARFIGDTAFKPTDEDRFTPRNWHALVDLAFSSIPVESQDGAGNDFIDSEKALTGSIGLDWLLYQHPASEDGYHTQVGIAGRVGLQTLREDPGQDLSSQNEFWGVGLTVRTSPLFRYSDPNPMPYAYATLTYCEYDTLNDHAFTFDGMIRFVPSQDSELKTEDPWGLFIGVRAIVNIDDGDDDLRFQVGVQDGLALLKDLFALPGKLVAGTSSEGSSDS